MTEDRTDRESTVTLPYPDTPQTDLTDQMENLIQDEPPASHDGLGTTERAAQSQAVPPHEAGGNSLHGNQSFPSHNAGGNSLQPEEVPIADEDMYQTPPRRPRHPQSWPRPPAPGQASSSSAPSKMQYSPEKQALVNKIEQVKIKNR